MLHGLLHLLGLDHENGDLRSAPGETLAHAFGPAQRTDRKGGAVISGGPLAPRTIAVLVAPAVLPPVCFPTPRSRDPRPQDPATRSPGLPAPARGPRHEVGALIGQRHRRAAAHGRHRGATAVPGKHAPAHARPCLPAASSRPLSKRRIGLKTEHGNEAFSLIKHTLLVLLGVLYFAWITDSEPWHALVFWQTVLAVWLTMAAFSYALPQLLYRRTTGALADAAGPAAARAGLAGAAVGGLAGILPIAGGTGRRRGGRRGGHPRREIEALISAGAEEGLIEEQDRKLIQSVVEFGDKVVREVMTPRPDIVAIQADSTLEQLRQLVINEQYSRIPAYEQNIDQIVGFVHVRDMFEVEESERESRTVRELVRAVPSCRRPSRCNDLMRHMQQENTHMVIVVDEYGNTAGLATMEDLLEVISARSATNTNPTATSKRRQWRLHRLRQLRRGPRRRPLRQLPPRRGYRIHHHRRPGRRMAGTRTPAGEVVDRDGVRIEVLASDERRVEQVRLTIADVAQNW